MSKMIDIPRKDGESNSHPTKSNNDVAQNNTSQSKNSTQMNKRYIGTKYEDMAANYLLDHGYQIIERNYRNSFGEIDIIAKIDTNIVFIEVKYRSNNRYGNPLEAVDYRKQKHISRAALGYCSNHITIQHMTYRFDVIAMNKDNTIEHIENAFEYQE